MTKPEVRAERLHIRYADTRWALLRGLRAEALSMMKPLAQAHINCFVYGSVARGDVSPSSDVDVFIPSITSSFKVQNVIEAAGFPVLRRVLVQATPKYAVKGYIEAAENRTYSFPLVRLLPSENDFYRFGGMASAADMEGGLRVVGVDKRLMLIEPTPEGHVESTVVGREDYVAKRLGVKATIVLDRVKALTRRDVVGRTGVFLKRLLTDEETFESALSELVDRNPAVRRRVRRRI